MSSRVENIVFAGAIVAGVIIGLHDKSVIGGIVGGFFAALCVGALYIAAGIMLEMRADLVKIKK